MERLLSVVDDVFKIEGRGVVVFPGIPVDSTLRVIVLDPIRLDRPDGSSMDTYIAGIELFGGLKPHPIPILLPIEITKSDVPIGTKVFVIPVGSYPQ